LLPFAEPRKLAFHASILAARDVFDPSLSWANCSCVLTAASEARVIHSHSLSYCPGDKTQLESGRLNDPCFEVVIYPVISSFLRAALELRKSRLLARQEVYLRKN